MLPINLLQSFLRNMNTHDLHIEAKHANKLEKNLEQEMVSLMKFSMNQKNMSKTNPLFSQVDQIQFNQSESSQLQQISMQFPQLVGFPFNRATVQWNGKKDNDEKINPDYCQILFYLDLKEIRETVLDVKVQNRIVTITIFNHTVGIDNLIEELKPTIKENLAKLQFSLASVKVINPNDEQQSQKDTQKGSGQNNGVDIKI
ncbi:hypothetical protein [Fredinandcohnia quinoae]|uniref:Flagellar hook-length control protein-like C-terminal domain-containing protein n=1 Tax=Fredinandcohnia quinoae TaxID=2918902 RepID=A0AAW5E2J5_9BACI|nr:hypothetical protein [Fredinandcohnia sp. SECRCQ15]MCH1623800.1 hypothetical protein [Fredinandcohnia sp. SECRCQ15]